MQETEILNQKIEEIISKVEYLISDPASYLNDPDEKKSLRVALKDLVKETLRPVKTFRDFQRPVIVKMRRSSWANPQEKTDTIEAVRNKEANLDAYIEKIFPPTTHTQKTLL